MNKPEHVLTNDKNWKRFSEHCEENGIGEQEEDWWPWWECWNGGYYSAFQDANEQDEHVQKRPGEN